MTKLQRVVFWCLIIALFLSQGIESLRHIVLPNDARETDATILLVLLLMVEWIIDTITEEREV